MSEHHRDGKLSNIIQSVARALPKGGAGKADAARRTPPDAEEIQAWLVARLSRQLRIAPEELNARESLASYGLDSRAAISLSGEMEEWLGRRLSPTLVWDYPTIEGIALHLAGGSDARQNP